ncbi:MAG: hypothetical protein FWB76_08045 [Oscillospiraceae bacterium]|nr:hypothetical protein [Oscillospiraceae bacterium]
MNRRGIYRTRSRNTNVFLGVLGALTVLLIALILIASVLWIPIGWAVFFPAVLLFFVVYNLHYNRKMVALMRELGVSDMEIERFEAEFEKNGETLLDKRVMLSDNYVTFRARQAHEPPVMFAPFIVLPLRELTRVSSCSKKVTASQYGGLADVHALEFSFRGNVFRLDCDDPAQAALTTDAIMRRKRREDDIS